MDPVGGDALGVQRRGGAPRRSEVEAGDQVGDPPVELLGEGPAEIAGAQPGLDVPHLDAAVERRQRSRQHRRGVPLDEDEIRPPLDEHPVEALQHPGGDVGERLAGAHHVEVDVRPQAEGLERTVEHLAMLRRGAQGHLEALGLVAQPEHHRRHLDRFGTGADHGQHPPAGAGAAHSTPGLKASRFGWRMAARISRLR